MVLQSYEQWRCSLVGKFLFLWGCFVCGRRRGVLFHILQWVRIHVITNERIFFLKNIAPAVPRTSAGPSAAAGQAQHSMRRVLRTPHFDAAIFKQIFFFDSY